MRKTTYHAVVCLLLCLPFVNLNAQLASWALTSDPSGISSNSSTHIAEDFTRGNGIGSLEYSSTGVEARAWPTDPRAGEVDYYEVCITPKTGITLNITGLQYSERRASNGIRAYELFWSTNDFATSNRIDSVGLPDDTNFRHVSISGLDIYSCDANPICFRWYGFAAESTYGEWKFKNDSLRINGTVLSACLGPGTQASNITFSNTTNTSTQINFASGSGDSRLVVMRANSAITAMPCNYATYNASATFGNGDDLGIEEYVVYNGPGNAVIVNGLEEGGLYYVAVYEYDDTNPCYNKVNPATSVEKLGCINPMDIENLRESPGNGLVNLSWENSNCFEEVLVVAGTSSITGVPSGDGMAYTANSVFGSGSGFGGMEYPVYKGSLSKIGVTGLTNGTTYYFKVFTRLGTTWSAGVEISSTPDEGCFDLGGNDVVFINEIHYRNIGDDIDEGVEIAGPADRDLASYELIFYEYLAGAGTIYKVEKLSGVIDNEGNDFGAVWFPVPDMRDGRAGIVLYNNTSGEIVQFLSYRGAFEATEGIANGMMAENITPAQPTNNPDSLSVQLLGTGTCPEDFYWVGLVLQTKGGINAGQNLLPIELLYFRATPKSEHVLVEWETVVEVNNDYMEVEHSLDGRNFKAIGKVAGAGTTLDPQYYQFVHTDPVPGINYYRLRQVDYNGTETYHKIVAVQFQTDEQVVLLYPTATKDMINLQLSAPLETTQQARIFDVTGRIITTQNLEVGESQWELPVSTLHPGHYFIQLELNGEMVVKRFIKN